MNKIIQISTIVTLLFAPSINFAQAPNLGTAANFVLFTSVGAVTNLETSTISGDVGTNNGAVTGFSSITGAIHEIDGASAMAVVDLQIAYIELLAATATAGVHDVVLGNGETLNAGAYRTNAATSLVGNLILDGQGNAGAVFLFNITGALSSATNAQVSLINGAQACNVFWAVDGALGLMGTSMVGTIINTGAINITGGSLDGRALSLNGAINTDAINAGTPAGCNVLPVTWLYFRGKPVQDQVLLEWGTTDEKNNAFFTLEKSRDGNLFEILTNINTQNEIFMNEHNYAYTDQHPYNICYYRISQTDVNGIKNYFRIIEVSGNPSFKIVHYVQESSIVVQISDAVNSTGFIKLYSVEGSLTYSQKIVLDKEPTTYKIDKPEQKGLYLLYVESNSAKLYVGKVMIAGE